MRHKIEIILHMVLSAFEILSLGWIPKCNNNKAIPTRKIHLVATCIVRGEPLYVSVWAG